MGNEIHSEKSRYKKPSNSESTSLSSEKDFAGRPTLPTDSGPLVDSLRRVWEARGFCGSGAFDQVDRYRVLMQGWCNGWLYWSWTSIAFN